MKQKVRKWLVLVLGLFMLVTSIPMSDLTAFADNVQSGIMNGGFESVDNEMPTNWDVVGTGNGDSVSVVKDSTVYMVTVGGNPGQSVENLPGATEAVTYVVSGKVKTMSAAASPLIDMWCNKTTTNRKVQRFGISTTGVALGEWYEFSFEYEAPAGTTSMLFYLKCQTDGPSYWDDVSMCVKGTENNLLQNGSFEEIMTSGFATGWPGSSSSEIVGTHYGPVHMVEEGDYAILVSSTKEDSDVYLKQKMQVDAGSVHTFSVKLQGYEDVATVSPYMKIHYYDAQDTQVGESYAADCSTVSGGIWKDINCVSIAPEGAVSASVTIGQTGIGKTLWDAVSLHTKKELNTVNDEILNGGFETELAGKPVDWVDNGTGGGDSISLLSDSIVYLTTTAAKPGQTIKNLPGDTAVTYVITGKVKTMSANASPLIDLWQNQQTDSHRKVQRFGVSTTGAAIGEWYDFSFEYEVPEGTTSIIFWIGCQTDSLCYWDDLTMCVKGTDTNLLTNGSFESIMPAGFSEGWPGNASGLVIGTDYGPVQTVAEGDKAVLFTGTTAESNVNLAQKIYVTAGESNEIKAKLQILEDAATVIPYMKITYFGADNVQVGETQNVDCSSASIGVWTELTSESTVPEGAVSASITIGQNGIGKTLWDDVKMPQPYVPVVMENLLINGTFDTLNVEGNPAAWPTYVSIQYGENAFAEKVDSDDYALKMINSTNASQKINQIVSDGVKENQIYTVAGKIKVQESDTSTPVKGLLDVYYYDGDGNQLGRTAPHFTLDVNNHTDWQNVSVVLNSPDETAAININLCCQGIGTLLWNDFMLVEGTVIPDAVTITEIEEIAVDFRNMLAEEASIATTEIVEPKGEVNTKDEPALGQSNLLINGSFEDNSGTNTVAGWNLNNGFSKYASIAEGMGPDGSDCIKFYVPKEDGLQNPFYDQWIKVIGGAEYQVSYKYMITGEEADPAAKMECWTDTSLPGARHIEEIYASTTFVGDGNWHEYTQKVYPSTNVEEIQFLIRSMSRGENISGTELYIDDVEIYMTKAPNAMKLNTDAVFYYSDEVAAVGENGIISTKINTTFYPELANAKVDLELKDAGNIIWQQLDNTSTNGEVTAEFSLSLLNKKAHVYEVVATLYNHDGSIRQREVQNIFVYDRPTSLSQEGVFTKDNGEILYPEYAYHVSRGDCDQYRKLKESGINVVQMGSFNNAASAVAALDAAEEAGVMGFIALYYDMKPAGDDSNIELTISIIEAVKDHPALFGYGVMDEVFLSLIDPEDELEASYRLIRSLDPKHPIMTMEAVRNYYEASGKYVDILCIDPYATAASQSVADAVEKAVQAVEEKKPVYALLEAYRNTHGRFPTLDDLRNNIWQSLIKDADAVGYYSITDSEIDSATGKWSIPIWNAKDGGALWKAICDFNTYEKKIAYDHFVFDKTAVYDESAEIGADYWYSSWKDGEDMYMVILSMLDTESATQEVSIPLSKAADAAYGRYHATALSGRINEQGVGEIVVGKDTLELILQGWETVLYKINAAEEKNVYTVAFDKNGKEIANICVEGSGAYTQNETAVLTAPISEGYNFLYWATATVDNSGSINGYVEEVLTSEVEYTVEVTQDTYLVAVYDQLLVEENTEGIADCIRQNSDYNAVIGVQTEGLLGIELDDQIVDSLYYTIDNENGNVCFDKVYTDSLSVGVHNVKFLYEKGYIDTVMELLPALKIENVLSDFSYKQKGNGEKVFVYCTGEFEKFVSVQINDILLDSSKYTAKRGSTIIEFKESYLQSLAVGTYNVKLHFTDGSIETKIHILAEDTVLENPVEGSINVNISEESSVGENISVTTASTGDNNNIILWILMEIISLSICSLVIVRKKT